MGNERTKKIPGIFSVNIIMAHIERFEDILSWKQAQDLIDTVYQIFGSMKDFGFRDQITRASVSISNNIAE